MARGIWIAAVVIGATAAVIGTAVAKEPIRVPVVAGTVNAFTEGDGQDAPLVCGIEFNGMTRDLRAISGSVNYVLDANKKQFIGIVKLTKGQIVNGEAVADAISNGALVASGVVLTENWKLVQGQEMVPKDTALHFIVYDPVQLAKTIPLLNKGAELVAIVGRQGRLESYDIGTIDAPTFDQFSACLKALSSQAMTALGGAEK